MRSRLPHPSAPPPSDCSMAWRCPRRWVALPGGSRCRADLNGTDGTSVSLGHNAADLGAVQVGGGGDGDLVGDGAGEGGAGGAAFGGAGELVAGVAAAAAGRQQGGERFGGDAGGVGGGGGDGAADGAQGDGVGDPVGVVAGAGGGAGPGGAGELAGAEQGPDFLGDPGGGLGAHDLAGAAGEDLDFPVAGLDGLITNGKFCCVRRLRLSLTWWRRPLRLRASVLQTDVALSGEPDDPDPDVDHLPPAQPAS